MTLVELVACGLAVWGTVEIWHHSALFASLRARVQAETGIIAEALLCPFCLSVWVALLSVTLMVTGLGVIVYVFAAARLANAANDLCYKYTRTPKDDFSVDEQEADDDEQRESG